MASDSPGQLVLSTLPYDYRQHLDRIVQHIRNLYPDLDPHWDGLVSNAARAMAEDVRGWLGGLSKAREALMKLPSDVVEIFERKGDGIKKPSPKGKAKDKDPKERDSKLRDDSKGPARSRQPSPARPTKKSKLELDASTLDWLHSRIDATLVGSSRFAENAGAPALLLLTFPPYTEARPGTEKACIWERGKFSLPLFQDEDEAPMTASSVFLHEERSKAELLFPVTEPASTSDLHRKARIVGGTFRIKGTLSAIEEAAVRNVVRVAVYTTLSGLLESAFFKDLNMPVATTPPPTAPSTPARPHVPLHLSLTEEPKTEHRHRHKASAVWDFLTGRHGRRKRNPAESELDEHTVVEVRSRSPPVPPPKDAPNSNEAQFHSTRGRGLSFLSRHPTVSIDTRKPPHSSQPNARFQHTLSQLSSIPLSTSPSVSFAPSPLLLHLRAKEAEYLASIPTVLSKRQRSLSPSRTTPSPEQRSFPLSGFDKAALRSLRGSDETLQGWLGHQAMTVLYSRWVHHPDPPLPPSATASSVQTVSEPSTPKPEESKRPDPDRRRALACVPPQWRTVMYYDGSSDRDLVTVIKGLCSLPGEKGDNICSREKCDRPWLDHRWGWASAGKRMEARLEHSEQTSEEAPSDAIEVWVECAECSAKTERRPTSAGSRSMSFAKYIELLIFSPTLLWPGLCAHTRPPKAPSDGLHQTIVPISPVMHRFLCASTTLTISVHPMDIYELHVPRLQIGKSTPDGPAEDPLQLRRDSLRLEIASWFGHSKRWMGHLETELREMKRLPRRPHRQDSDTMSTPRSSSPTGDASSHSPMAAAALTKHLSAASALRATIHSEESALYGDLKPWSAVPLNDVRRRFKVAANQVRGRMEELEALYGDTVGPCTWDDPFWWKGQTLVLPGSWIMFKEEDVGAIISYTLSSHDYRRALEEPLGAQPAMSSKSPDTDATEDGPNGILDSWSAVMSRRESPRDVGALLTMQLGSKRSNNMNGTPPKSSTTSTPPSSFATKGTPKDAWAPADVAVSYQSARGDLNAADDVLIEKLLQDMDGAAEPDGGGLKQTTPSRLSQRPLNRTVSVSSVAGQRLLESVEAETSPIVPSVSPSSMHNGRSSTSGRSRSSTGSTVMQVPLNLRHGPDTSVTTSTAPPPSSMSDGMSTLADVMSYLTNTTRSFFFGNAESEASATSRLPLLAVERARLPVIEEKPHLRYDWSVGKKLRFSCTVYYAQQFEALRRLCGVETELIESLSECAEWKAEGGKSRSRFFKSKDDRYIIKTLVNAWHVSDLGVLLDVAPIFFRYIDSLGDRPTTLAKLLGFYSVEVKNSETSAQTKIDVLVMENLFYKQRTDRQYDLKGIEGRRVKALDKKTFFDVEFLESQKRAPVYVTPHSRLVVREAIRSDAAFLTSANIMDYSMLLGVDDQDHTIACGLVDTIGSYNVAKTLEYTAKQSLKSGKDVTVMPPAEYEARFVSAMESYLIACPDKWTKPPRGQPLHSNVTDLPAVL
ncbi:hypothetical protein CALCODRAFT_468352 [Calocera cornea HHB12733]|uniref:PIPK domain-containing protein n=1 Tax=Calocera cornea HHB12733 TaxID=1353952 RepID=A0A165GS94_9BASI|nr:hypothetical protein CALCODRAFT_468352 [Calocera cornea HHB12733]